MHQDSSSKRTLRPYLQLGVTIAAFLAVFIAFVIPSRLSWITPLSLVNFPLEALVLGAALLVPGRVGRFIRYVAAALLAIGVICKLADMAAYQIFARHFNPVFDAYLLADGVNLLTGAIGRTGALAVAALLMVLVIVLCVLAFAAMRRIQAVLQHSPRRSIVALSSLTVVFAAVAMSGTGRTSTFFYDQLVMHGSSTVNSLADIRDFRRIVNEDSTAAVPGDSLFGRLEGKDVLVLFIESYGRSVLESPEFARHLRPVLEQGSAELASHGLHARSAWLTSPTVGGISWLAHGTALSGLWIDSQMRYDSLIMSDRPTLVHLFQRAGWRTVAAMPAITMPWPEGDYFGYDRIYAAADLGYQGLPFNWVTMPDQYVLSAFERRERRQSDRRPVMAVIALISSHAPWTPVPQVVPWADVDGGRIFNTQALAGDSPEEVWQDDDRIREQYRKSIEYVIANLVSYAIHYGGEDLVMLIMGDHQPAPLVTGEPANRDVPVHLIAGDPAVIDAIADWQWTEGLLPASDAPVWRMDGIRHRFVKAFSMPARQGQHVDVSH